MYSARRWFSELLFVIFTILSILDCLSATVATRYGLFCSSNTCPLFSSYCFSCVDNTSGLWKCFLLDFVSIIWLRSLRRVSRVSVSAINTCWSSVISSSDILTCYRCCVDPRSSKSRVRISDRVLPYVIHVESLFHVSDTFPTVLKCQLQTLSGSSVYRGTEMFGINCLFVLKGVLAVCTCGVSASWTWALMYSVRPGSNTSTMDSSGLPRAQRKSMCFLDDVIFKVFLGVSGVFCSII